MSHWLILALACVAADAPAEAPARGPSDECYTVRYVASPEVVVDGAIDEAAWSRAVPLRRFTFPWKTRPAPPTEFRALCDADHLYVAFRVHDEQLVVLDRLRDEQDAVLEDRVEVYFSADDKMERYYCMEIDPRGRVFDYRGSYYRKLDADWDCPGIRAAGSIREDGYAIEAAIPLDALEGIGLPRLRPGAEVLFGVYRAEFRPGTEETAGKQEATIHNLGRQLDGPPPIEAWMAWIDPGTDEPDFHVPSALGRLKVVDGDAAGVE